MKDLLISFSGGRTSAFMAFFLMNYPKFDNYRKHIVFANTGMEHEETLIFIDKCNRLMFDNKIVWLEAYARKGKRGHSINIVDFKTAHRQKDIHAPKHPFRLHIEKYGFPSMQVRHCTRDLKIRAIDKYMKDIAPAGWVKAIGIRADEGHRRTPETCEKGMQVIYPLKDYIDCSKNMIRNWWYNHVFDLKLKGEHAGNCAGMCYLMSLRKKATAILDSSLHPLVLEWLIELEKNTGMIMDRGGKDSFASLLEMSQDPNFEPYKDGAINKNDIRLDLEMSCLCGV